MNNKMKIGILREGKIPPDHRVPLTPSQCSEIQKLYSNVEIFVQPSPIRAYKDEEYLAAGITMQEDLSNCDLIIGVKEVQIADLIPYKKFMFFSHTIKKQPYNRELLRAILAKKIQLIDYELLKNKQNKRVIGFGRYAGIVGAYNAFRALGLKTKKFDLKRAIECKNRVELEEEMKKIIIDPQLKIVLTGFGRVGHGAREIIDLLPIKEISPEEFVQPTNEPVFTHLDVEDYYGRKDGGPFDKMDFYAQPEKYMSTFEKYVPHADIYIPCHFWSSKAPFILTNDDLQRPDRRITVVADISCDVKGPIACTIRASKISDPIYGYDPKTGEEVDFSNESAIAVMAVDNLPCELPLDASEDFGNELMRHVIPALLLDDPDHMIERASETNFEGRLNDDFKYLQAYVDGLE